MEGRARRNLALEQLLRDGLEGGPSRRNVSSALEILPLDRVLHLARGVLEARGVALCEGLLARIDSTPSAHSKPHLGDVGQASEGAYGHWDATITCGLGHGLHRPKHEHVRKRSEAVESCRLPSA